MATCEYAMTETTMAKIPIETDQDIVLVSMAPTKNKTNPMLSIANQIGWRLFDTSLEASDL